jgi:hypothetical protein
MLACSSESVTIRRSNNAGHRSDNHSWHGRLSDKIDAMSEKEE